MSAHCYPIITNNSGLGALGVTNTTIAQESASLLGTTGSILAATAVVGGPVGAAIAGAAALAQIAIGFFKGCGDTCIASTKVANEVSVALNNLSSTYFSLPAPRTQSEQAAALSSFDQIQAALISGCTQVGGQGGQQCIADRSRGGKFDDYVLRDRIAADPVIPDPSTEVTDTVSSMISNPMATLTKSPMLLVGLLLGIGGLIFMSSDKGK